MRIITISREFGSGGRELGKRLADALEMAYYDKEIIAAIAENKGMDQSYVETILDNSVWKRTPLHFRCSLSGSTAMQLSQTKLMLEQKQVIEAIAKAGRDCVIVGRNADVILQEYAPFNLFVCADMETKVCRLMERAKEGEQYTKKELERRIRSMDKNRAQNRELLTDSPWGGRGVYHLTVNTTDWEIKELVPAVATFAQRWFGRSTITQ